MSFRAPRGGSGAQRGAETAPGRPSVVRGATRLGGCLLGCSVGRATGASVLVDPLSGGSRGQAPSRVAKVVATGLESEDDR